MDLGTGAQITGLKIYSRSTGWQYRIGDLEIRVGNTNPNTTALNTQISVNQVYANYNEEPTGPGQVRLHKLGGRWAAVKVHVLLRLCARRVQPLPTHGWLAVSPCAAYQRAPICGTGHPLIQLHCHGALPVHPAPGTGRLPGHNSEHGGGSRVRNCCHQACATAACLCRCSVLSCRQQAAFLQL